MCLQATLSNCDACEIVHVGLFEQELETTLVRPWTEALCKSLTISSLAV